MWSALPAISAGRISMRAAWTASCSIPTTIWISATSIAELRSPVLHSFPPGAGEAPITKEFKREKAIASHFRLCHLWLSAVCHWLLPGFHLGYRGHGADRRAVSRYSLL